MLQGVSKRIRLQQQHSIRDESIPFDSEVRQQEYDARVRQSQIQIARILQPYRNGNNKQELDLRLGKATNIVRWEHQRQRFISFEDYRAKLTEFAVNNHRQIVERPGDHGK